MPRVNRSQLEPYGVFHVTSRGVGRMAIVDDEADGQLFLRFLRRSAGRFGWDVHAYCLMTNHFHLIVEGATGALSGGMQLLNWSFARRFNDRRGRAGHVFESRFRAAVIADDDYYERACAYVWNNPVAVGLVDAPDDWPWSGRLR
jgi:REP element-mobilizing transposase RayT